ncbi:cytochrome-c peroxidase [Sinorhizobium meliloti]|jgi:cytochrome c peroxidase|uniref:cytochrome-c peroxidase n=1 Tax=Rhizobium meliloti TaxID=382 RepID=UPI0020C0189A|nr:cytochrome c peroxidase [Sinorhizobium meliloti]
MARGLIRTAALAAGALLVGHSTYYHGFFAQAQADLDQQLEQVLKGIRFTGRTDESLERRLGRPVSGGIVEIGKFLFFDKIQGLHGDNSCAGCHAPAAGFGGFESIAIGVDNNDVVGPNRKGPRNQRRTPMVLNNAFYPKLMWNGRFFAPSGDPFDNSQGFAFPNPEGTHTFPADDPNIKILLAAQGHIPGTELPELAGFTGITGTFFATQRFFATRSSPQLLSTNTAAPAVKPVFELFPAGGAQVLSAPSPGEPDYAQFDDGHGVPIPAPEADGTRNVPIRAMIEERINDIQAYRDLFAKHYPEVAEGKPITFAMIGQALSEFQVSLTFADAPIDRFARGDHSAMTAEQKRGALLFFGKARCSTCHTTAGQSNEMFSDFEMHNVGVPQIAPKFGKGTGNVAFRNADGDFKIDGVYDFGLADIRDPPNEGDRFKFRTSPLRNLHLQHTFFHNGSYTRLEDAIRDHLDPISAARSYDPAAAGVADDLHTLAPMDLVLKNLDPLIREPIELNEQEFGDLVSFVRDGLADPAATPEELMKLKPDSVPSGLPLQTFE